MLDSDNDMCKYHAAYHHNKEDNKMKKRITALILTIAAAISMVGCGSSKTTVHISIDGIGEYELAEIPAGLVNTSKTAEDGLVVTVKENGDYDFVVRGDDGQDYEFTLEYKDGEANIKTAEDIDITVSTEEN